MVGVEEGHELLEGITLREGGREGGKGEGRCDRKSARMHREAGWWEWRRGASFRRVFP